MEQADIVFFADNHFGTRPGYHQYLQLREDYRICFVEGDYAEFVTALETNPQAALALNAIAGTDKDRELPGEEVETAVRQHVQNGKPVFLLHGASAAFWNWQWWRDNMALRWVRGNDPEEAAASWHPVEPYHLKPTVAGVEAGLKPADMPRDEIYCGLEERLPYEMLMSTELEGRTWPQAYRYEAPGFKGTAVGFLPGHNPDVIALPSYVSNLRALFQSHL